MGNQLTDLAAKGMEKAKGVKATFKGFEGIFKRLTEEHGEAGALLKRVAKSDDPEVRADIWPKLRHALLAHEHGEMNILYPELRNHELTRELASEHDEEARAMESLIERIDDCAYDSDEWKTMAQQLLEMVAHHVEEEEGTYFPQAQEVLGEARASALKDAYCQAKPDGETSEGAAGREGRARRSS